MARVAGCRHHHRQRPGPGLRLRPRGQDPPGQRRRLRPPRLPPGRADRAVAVTHHLPDETREFLAALREVVERGVTRNARLNPESASGEVIPTTLNASALRDPDGRVIGAIGILRDMRELDKARAYAESLIKNAPDPVFVSDLEGKILQANDAVSQLLGFRQDEVLEQSLSRFISPEETREFTAALREVVARGVTRNARLNPRSAS